MATKLPKNYKPSKSEKFMNAKQKEYFRLKLKNWKNDIYQESRETVENLQDSIAPADISDRATQESELSVFAFEMRVGFGQVGDLHLLGIPVEALARELTGDNSEAEGLGEGTCVVETCEGLVLALDRIEELGVVVDSFDVRFGDVLQNGIRVEGGHGTVGENHPSAFAHEDRTLLGQLVAIGQDQVGVVLVTGSLGPVPPGKGEVITGVF